MSKFRMDEVKLRIIALWESGLTALQIGAQLGLTRNAVIGRIDRMRMQGVVIERIAEPKAAIAIEEKQKKFGPRPKSAPLKTRPYVNWFTKTRPDAGLLLMSLKVDSCRYVMPSKHEGQHIYCGDPITRGPYCTDHAALCFVSIKDYKRQMKAVEKSFGNKPKF